MTASTMLMALPRDATAALASAGEFDVDKVVVRWKPVGSAPPPPHPRNKITATQKFEGVVFFLRRALKVKDSDSLFLYVNSTFAPALDEVVGNLHRASYRHLCVEREVQWLTTGTVLQGLERRSEYRIFYDARVRLRSSMEVEDKKCPPRRHRCSCHDSLAIVAFSNIHGPPTKRCKVFPNAHQCKKRRLETNETLAMHFTMRLSSAEPPRRPEAPPSEWGTYAQARDIAWP